MNLEKKHLELIQAILNQSVPNAQVWLFGSRAHGHTKPWSDIDLAIDMQQKMSLGVLGKLREAFQESILPLRVDIVDLQNSNAEFRDEILKTAIKIK